MSNSTILSWPEWFDRAAQVFKDPRMKIAYYNNGLTGEPYSQEVVRLTHQDIYDKISPLANHPDSYLETVYRRAAFHPMGEKFHSSRSRGENHFLSRNLGNHVVLDVGCGVGYFTKFFGDKMGQIIGTDVSVNMLRTAHSMNPNHIFIVAKAHELPFSGGIFDRVFSYGVTQYLSDERMVQKMLDEMCRLLKANGRILVGDILEPIEETQDPSCIKPTPKGKPWWPHSLDHDLKKLYVARQIFRDYGFKKGLTVKFFNQNISGRSLPTPRYDVILTRPSP